MPSKSSAPITVRLPRDVIDAVEAEADALGLSRSEVVSRRLKRTFSSALEFRKSDEIAQNSEDSALGDVFA